MPPFTFFPNLFATRAMANSIEGEAMSHNVFTDAMSNNEEWQDEEGRAKEERIRADLQKMGDKVTKKGGRINGNYTDDYQAANGMWYSVFETGYKPQASNEEAEKAADKIVKALLAQEGMTVGTEDGPLFGRRVPKNRGSERKGGSGAGYSTEDKTALATTSGGGLSGACSSGDAAESKGIATGYQPQRGPGQSASSAGQGLGGNEFPPHDEQERRELRQGVGHDQAASSGYQPQNQPVPTQLVQTGNQRNTGSAVFMYICACECGYTRTSRVELHEGIPCEWCDGAMLEVIERFR